MDETFSPGRQPEKLDRNYKKKRVEEIGSTLAQIRARHKASRSSCPKKEDDSQNVIPKISQEKLSEKNEFYMLLEEDRVKAEKLVRERPKIKEALENLKIDREQQKMVEKKLEETRAKQAAPLPEIPPEIQKRIFEMEMTIHNLRENLGEKDKVLSSKTESLKMLNEQLSQRSSEFMGRAEVMRQEIDLLKDEYSRQEELIKNELTKTKKVLEQTQNRLVEKETECKTYCSVLEELETLKTTHANCENELENVKKNLETVTKSSQKLMVQVKALRTERDNLKKERSGSEIVESLQNRIALLEDEKGNLQLQLVDFDESKELAIACQKKMEELEEALQMSRNSFDGLQNEKNFIFGKLESANSTITYQENLIKQMELAFEEIKQSKITAEMKAVELEEKLDSGHWEENKVRADKLEIELINLKECLTQHEDRIHSLNNKLFIREKKMCERITEQGDTGVTHIVPSFDDLGLKSDESELTDGFSQHNKWPLEKSQEPQHSYENIINDLEKLNFTIKEKDIILESNKIKIGELTCLIGNKDENISILEKQVTELKITEETLKKQAQALSESGGHNEPSDLYQKYVKIAANFKIKAKLCQELKENIAELNNSAADKEQILGNISQEKLQLETKIGELIERIDKLEEISKAKDESIRNLELSMEELSHSSESLQDVHSEISKRYEENLMEIKEMKEKLQFLGEREVDYIHQKSENDALRDDLSKLQHELESMLQSLEEKDKIIHEVDTEREKLKNELSNHEIELDRIRRTFEGESLKSEEICSKYREEIDHLLEQLSEVSSRLEHTQINLQERENYIETLELGTEALKSKIQDILFGFEENKKLMDEKTSTLGARLQEAELANEKFEKYQSEMEEKVKKFEENENVLVSRISEANDEMEGLKRLNLSLLEKNDEMEQSKETSYIKINEMETELSTLKNVRDAYNCTLDQIEILNEDLKQVRAQIESRNQELIAVDKQRRNLVEKLSDMEDSYSDLHSKFKESEGHVESLKTELEMKGKYLEEANQEILALQAQLSISQTIESQNMARELEISNIKMFYEDQIQILQQEKEDLLGVLKTQVSSEVNNVMSMAEDRLSRLDMTSRDNPQQGIGMFKWNETPSSVHRDMSFEEAKDEEDGWGWIASEVKLEQEQKNADAMKVQELLQKIQDLEEEKIRISEDLKISETKCNKLKKIAKEVKVQNDMLKKSKAEKSTGLEDLGFALQEELRSQVDKVEQENKDLTGELNLLKTEKERLLKRVDTLTSANDRLIEMKERQDFEVQMWKKRSNELKNQVQGLEWNLEELRASDSSHSENEVEEKLSALVSENEELQRIICELKDNSYYKYLDEHEQFRNPGGGSECEIKNIELLKEELAVLHQQYNTAIENNGNLNKQLMESIDVQSKDQVLMSNTLEELRLLKQKDSDQLQKIDILLKEKNCSTIELENLVSEKSTLIININCLENENKDLTTALKKLKEENISLMADLKIFQEDESQNESLRSSNELKLLGEQLMKENSELKKEMKVLGEKIIKENMSLTEGTPPVFRGFSSVHSEVFLDVSEQADKTREEVEARFKEKDAEILKCKEEIMKLSSDKVRMEQDFMKLNAEKSRMEEEICITLEAERNAFTVFKDNFMKECQSKEEEINGLKKEVTLLMEALDKLKTREKKDGMYLEYEELWAETRVLKEQKDILSGEINNLQEQFVIKLKEIVQGQEDLKHRYLGDLKQNEENYQQVLLNKDEENAHLMCEISSKDQQYAHLMVETKNLEREVARLVCELDEAKNKLQGVSQGEEKLNSEIGILKKENACLKNKDSEVINLLAQVDYLTQSMTQKDSLCEKLSEQVEKQVNILRDLNDQTSQSEVDIQVLESTCNSLRSSLEIKESEIDKIKTSLENLESETILLKQENKTQQVALEEKNKEIELLQSSRTKEVVEPKMTENAEINALTIKLAEKDIEIEKLSKILTETQEKLIEAEEGKLSDEMLNLRSNLDVALYTLHLRDVRCEELTLEIMQLLEERDTLQLRLSETLRLNERLTKSSPLHVSPADEQEETDANNSHPGLSTFHDKIGELHSGYRKDPSVQHERESRHSQQMQLYTQKNAKEEQDLNSSNDYGLFNWFFASSSPSPSSPRTT